MMTIPLWQRIKIIFNLQINQRGKHLINTNICILLCFSSIIYLWLFSCLLCPSFKSLTNETQHTLPVTSTTNPLYVSPELGKMCKRTLRINLPFDIQATSPWCFLNISASCLERMTRAELQHLHRERGSRRREDSSISTRKWAGGEQRRPERKVK